MAYVLYEKLILVEVGGSFSLILNWSMLAALTLILTLNYIVYFFNDRNTGESGGGSMEIIVTHIYFLVVSIADGVSAVCSGLVSAVLTSGCGLEVASPLDFHLS